MAVSEFEIKRWEKRVAEFIGRRRPPPHLRAKLDLAFRFEGQSVEILEIRPHWQDADRILELLVAKATYNETNRT